MAGAATATAPPSLPTLTVAPQSAAERIYVTDYKISGAGGAKMSSGETVQLLSALQDNLLNIHPIGVARPITDGEKCTFFLHTPSARRVCV